MSDITLPVVLQLHDRVGHLMGQMGQLTNLLLALLVLPLSLCWGQRSDGRPSCGRCDLRLSCNCSSDGFTQVPMVTEEALGLDLSFNNISVVTVDDLRGHRVLRTLSLHSKT